MRTFSRRYSSSRLPSLHMTDVMCALNAFVDEQEDRAYLSDFVGGV